jgi:ubiquinone biosynthesis protein UbiJ
MAATPDKLPDLLCRPVQALLNRGLRQSATAQALATGLEGRAVQVSVEGLPLEVRIDIRSGEFAVSSSAPVPADAVISGTPAALARLLGPGAQDAIREGAVRFTGDTELAERFRKLLQYARPDLEEALSRVVGDPVAYQVGRFVTSLSAWRGRALQSIGRSVSEYLQEESQLVPSRQELAAFAASVDELVNDVERAEAGLRDLRSKLGASEDRSGA